MALVDFYGYDDSVAENGYSGSAAGATANTRTGVGGAISLGVSNANQPLASSGGTRVIGFGYMAPDRATGVTFFGIFEGAICHLSLRLDASNHLQLYRGNGTTLLATSTWVMPAVSAWTYFEIKAVIHDTTGSVEIRADGNTTPIISVSGVDTRNAGTGVIDTLFWSRLSGSGAAVDDVYVEDTNFLGDVVVRTLLPNGNGASSQWTGSDGNSVDNYLLVDEPNSSATDYVGAAAASLTDLYTLFDLPAGYTPLATQLLTYAAKSDGGTPPVLKPVTRGDGGTVLEESAITLSTTYQVFRGAIRTTDPDGDALTLTNVNGMQAGVRSA